MSSTDPRFTLELVKALPALSLSSLRRISQKHVQARQDALIGFIRTAYLGNRPHKRDPKATSFSAQELRQALKVCGSRYITCLLPFFSFPFTKRGFSKQGKSTKPYRLLPQVRRAVTHAYRLAKDDPLGSPVSEERSSPKPLDTTLAGCSFVPFTLPGLLTEITLTMAQRALKGCTRADARTLGWLVDSRNAIRIHGGLPNGFEGYQTNGRLQYAGDVHLVPMSKRARRLLLQDTGWADYDIASAHLSIFVSLGKRFGFPTEQVQQYLANKDACHTRWARATGHDCAADFKDLVLSFLNGGSLAPIQQTASGAVFGVDTIARMRKKVPSLNKLYTETRSGMREVVSHFSSQGACWNAVNAVRTGGSEENEAPRPLPFAQACSHILTGYEQFAIRVLCARLTPGSLKTIIFDGWISSDTLSDCQLSDLETHLRDTSKAALGVELALRIKCTPFARRT
jgi:hypothetical protein